MPRGKMLVLAVLLIFGAAATGIGILRFDQREVRKAQTLLGQVQLNVAELNDAEVGAIADGRITIGRSIKWSGLATRTRVRYARFKPLALEEIPSRRDGVRRIEVLFREYVQYVREEFAAVRRGDLATARRIDRDRVDPTFEALAFHLRRTWAHLDATARSHSRTADIGSLLLILGALALVGWLIRKSSRIERAAELRSLEEQNLRESGARLRALLQHASDTIAVVDEGGLIRNLTGSAQSLFGGGWESLLESRIDALVHPDDRSLLVSFLANTAGERGKEGSLELRMSSTEDQWRHVQVVATNLLDEPYVHGIVLTLRDVSSRKAFEDQLRHKAFHDSLTQLPNRALFYDRVEHALAGGGTGDELTAVLFVDLDDFKLANDALGHAGGDELLVKVAERLSGSLRSGDTAARLGGDEFGVLVEGVGGPGQVVEMAGRVLGVFDEPFIVRGEAVSMTASVGIAISVAGSAVEGLLRNADLAMYAAKRKGKARHELFNPALEEAVLREQADANGQQRDDDRIGWVLRGTEQREEILSVLDRPGTIETVFQPIVDIRTGLARGYEALSRFNVEPIRPPNVWFDQAHRCGLGPRLEAEALRLALGHPGRPAGTYLSVNLSPSALVSDEVQEVLPEDISELVIEITENELVTKGGGVPAALSRVREHAARLAVDDAGAGYAGLQQLMRLRPDMIKLDRSLVDGVSGDVAKTALVDALVLYARSIGASVCAEGIETLEDLRALADLDVSYGQGYVLARPAPPWPVVSPDASAVCTKSLNAAIRHDESVDMWEGRSDRRLEQLSRRLFEASRFADMNDVMELVAAELRADEVACQVLVEDGAALMTVASYGWPSAGDSYALGDLPASRHVLATGDALQILISDPSVDASELQRMVAAGVKSMIKLPITARGQALGMLELCSHRERPWSRTEINRARLISYQLAAVLSDLMRDGAEPGSQRVPHAQTPAPIGLQAIRERMKATST